MADGQQGTNAAILQMLEGLRSDLATEREATHESWATTHKRIDELIDRVGRVETTVAISGQVSAQSRNQFDALEREVRDQIAPTVEEWQRMLKTSRRLMIVLGISPFATAGAVAAAFTWGGDWLVSLIRKLLRID